MGGQGEPQMEDGGDGRRMHTGEKRGLGVGGRQVGQRGKVQGLVLWWVDSAGTALVDRNRKTPNEEVARRRTSRHPPLTPRDEPTLNERRARLAFIEFEIVRHPKVRFRHPTARRLDRCS
ncbi:hypothetical protein [Nocardia farcinica]|uniref:hypothetical protein n=2 Tax=Nocardia farcinica TaxID=37329 RepID=UPI00189567C4|nr:hypothetical protein [Nocardia farcinica]MBF6295814.1 hypothetical protein [Nocardia farcinica]